MRGNFWARTSLSYFTGVESTHNLWFLLALRLVKNKGFMDPGLRFIHSCHNHHLWRVIRCVNVITLFLLTFTLTLVGNFLNILQAGKGLNWSPNKRIKRINLNKSKKIGYRLTLRNTALLLFYYLFTQLCVNLFIVHILPALHWLSILI